MSKRINITITGALGRRGKILIKCTLENKKFKLYSLTDLKFGQRIEGVKVQNNCLLLTLYLKNKESNSNLEEKLPQIISILNSYVKTSRLLLYNIQNRQHITVINPNNRQILWAEISIKKILCIVAILCVISGNYEYSFDKYPIKIYEYFMGIVQP